MNPKVKRARSKHPRQTDTPESITCRQILILSDKPVSEDNQKNRICVHVCQWSRGKVQLEVRRYYLTKAGAVRWYKTVGISMEILKLIADNQQEIIAALQQ